jgi:alkanesulfonate monooxygenase SsuD/methylene tetrahydromethanopterin reductase-like flavin-dependent oxidoreductase (luciferase family)
MLDVIIPLLEGEATTYRGKFYSIDQVTIEPRSGRRPEIWIGGGSQLADPSSPESGHFAEAVKARILRTEGWIPRPTCPPHEIGRDWKELQEYLRAHHRDPATLTVAHENFMHLVRTLDPVAAREEQHRAFSLVMSDVRGPAYLEKVYLFGTPEEIIGSLQARIDAGVERFMLHTMTPDPRQLEHWLTEIVANVRFPEPLVGSKD